MRRYCCRDQEEFPIFETPLGILHRMEPLNDAEADVDTVRVLRALVTIALPLVGLLFPSALCFLSNSLVHDSNASHLLLVERYGNISDYRLWSQEHSCKLLSIATVQRVVMLTKNLDRHDYNRRALNQWDTFNYEWQLLPYLKQKKKKKKTENGWRRFQANTIYKRQLVLTFLRHYCSELCNE